MAYEIWHMKYDCTPECLSIRLNILSKLSESACLLLIVVACALSLSCAKAPPQRAEEKPIPPETKTPPDIAAVKSDPNLPAPEPAEVNQAIERVFKGAVTIVTDRTPYYIVGDFNGDHSQDLAVVARPTPGKLLGINDELAPWILVDPIRLAKPASKGAPYPELHSEMTRRRRVVVNDGDTFLAIIHGCQSKGWRDSQATQTYVLKNAAGDKMEPQARKQIVWAGNKERLPRIWGDVIAQSIGERYGFLYYNGAKYDWYDPRGYKPSPPAKIIHGGGATASR
jgi:hypothetical protein